MVQVRFPFDIKHFPTVPPLKSNPDITDDIQQTLATLVGFDGTARQLLRVTPSGMLQTVNPLAKKFINILAVGAGYVWDGSDIKCSEVAVKANSDNTGIVWVNIFDDADADVGWPLAGGEHIVLSLTNLSFLHLKIITHNEKAILYYTQ